MSNHLRLPAVSRAWRAKLPKLVVRYIENRLAFEIHPAAALVTDLTFVDIHRRDCVLVVATGGGAFFKHYTIQHSVVLKGLVFCMATVFEDVNESRIARLWLEEKEGDRHYTCRPAPQRKVHKHV